MKMKGFFPQRSLIWGSSILYIGMILLAIISESCQKGEVEFSPEITSRLPEKIDYNLHVKPLLSDRCFACHGPDKNSRKADLRLDTEEGARMAMGDDKDHYAIVKGKPHKSEVFNRIFTDDAELMMPPPESNLKLDEYEKALITRWIEQGAEYKPHWSFIPPEKDKLPEVQEKEWAQNEIDNFILANLEKENIAHAPKASKETLIRRVAFDLTGLPPTLEEIDSFLEDKSDNAYEKMVDHFLASPHYGERLATEWLDIARYADSHGYQDDGMRNMWPWRDWVIEKFNQNLPMDTFITWQLAGDLLPNPNKEQLLATGFNRNHMQSQEGGIVSEEYRVEYVADRTQTFGKAFLGLTIECARCHDHKYDPVSQEEYFKLFGFFNSVNESGQIPYTGEASPTLILNSPQAEDSLAAIKAHIATLEQELNPSKISYLDGFEKWLSSAKQNMYKIKWEDEIGSYSFDETSGEENRMLLNKADKKEPAKLAGAIEDLPIQTEGKSGKGLELKGDSHIDFGRRIGFFEKNEPFSISLWVKILKEGVHGPIITRSGGLMNGNRGFDLLLKKNGILTASINHTFPANSIAVETTDSLKPNEWYQLAMTWDGSGRAEGFKLYHNGKTLPTKVMVDNLESSILHYGKKKENWGGMGSLSIGRQAEETLSDVVADECHVFARELTLLEIEKLFTGVEDTKDPLKSILTKETLNTSDKDKLYAYYLQHFDKSYQNNLKDLKVLRAEQTRISTDQQEVMIMRDLPKPRKTYILDRGAYDSPTTEVQPGTPSYVLNYPENLPKNRLGLVKWTFNPENPLPARVLINRYWQMIFGKGLVPTSDDFGNQGDLPKYPELLDWMAVTFRESGWDLKAMLKLMVMSATYQQSSFTTKELREKDPDNLLLARAPAYRMSAEMVRDNALKASGLLNDTIGGPSVKPYQPAGLWKQLATRNATVYIPDHGSKLYRRSMYTIWKRTTPPPSMISFDAAERNFCTVKRQKTSTPLQSLVLLNDPQFVEASRIIAERMMKESDEKIENQIQLGFRLLTGRKAGSDEMSILARLYEAELEAFKSGESNANELLATGEKARDKSLDTNELAALTMVASTLMNFDETVFKR
ncbi:DUF1553 domain-containing protein [Chondrinema litorale]|uniref:DUF1553 domain-containing protein n=1 Tax=Chondrinema litorale TaxID=2994555 RepID=UPI002543EB79|nr:DUF1553 domain-containing protein [Chondrinema litorale]UZR99344.1 DUF1553 domain-containing protein [Chondrinema litorale]